MLTRNKLHQGGTMNVLVVALVLALSATVLGCAAKPEETQTPKVDTPGKGQTYVLASDSIFTLSDPTTAEKLYADMNAGRIPTSCNVLYDEMGGRPVVDVTDPKTITRLFELASQIKVVGETNISVTDSYHHFYFTLQDGSAIGFSFEGAGIVYMGRTNYEVSGDGALWSYVRELQNVD